MATGPGEVIAAPPITPFPTGLLRSAAITGHDDIHFGSALEWPPENCTNATVLDPCSAALLPTATNRPAKIRFDAFAVHTYDVCSAFGWQTAEYEARARRAIAARESKAVEAEWWTGTLFSTNPHLAKAAGANGPNATTLAGGAAQSLRISLAFLVQELADRNGGAGMIHCRPFLAQMWYGLQLLRVDGAGKLWTVTGNQVVPGAGYPGTGPAAEVVTTTSEWAFATDEVAVHRSSDVAVFGAGANAESIYKDTNTVLNRAERLYALTFNGCVNVAVNINPTQTA